MWWLDVADSNAPRERRWRRMRDQVNRVWADEDPPTLIDGPPPLRSWNVRRPLPAPVEMERQRSFEFAQRVGAVMLARGAAVDDVEASVRAAALAMGLPRPEVDVTFTSILVTLRPDPDHPPLTSVGGVHQRSEDHSRLVATHQLLLALTTGKLTRDEAFEVLAEIERRPHPYGDNVVTLARGTLAAAIVAQLGGSWAAVLVVGVIAMVIDLAGRAMSRHQVPTFYLNVVGGLIATVAAAVSTALGAQQNPSLVVAGSIIVLLPGATLVNGVRDALSNYYVTGVARVFEVVVAVGGLVGGVALGLAVSQALDVNMSVIPYSLSLDDLPVRVVSAAIAAVAAGVAYFAPYRLLPAIAISGAAGMLVLALVQETGIAPVASYAAAALTAGGIGYVFAHAHRALPVTITVAGILSLLPGLTIYTGLLQLTTGDAFGGIVSLVAAGARALTVASAVLAAALLLQPFLSRTSERHLPKGRGDDEARP